MRVPGELWGSGHGPVRRLQPHMRVLCSLFVTAACLVIPLNSGALFAAAAAVATGWCLFCGLRFRSWIICVAAGAVFSFPLLLLTPWVSPGGELATLPYGRLMVTAAIATRTTLCMCIAAALVSSLPLSETHRAVTGLPLPTVVKILLVQIVNRLIFMTEQTSWVIKSLRLRSAGRKPGLDVIRAFPVVWMTRMLAEAERTGAAMVLRGYAPDTAVAQRPDRATPADIAALGGAMLLCLAAAFARAGGFR